MSLKLTSPAFENNTEIPSKFTCDGINVSPPLLIEEAPVNTASFVLIVDDPDAPTGTWSHWLLWNIDANTTEIYENSTPLGATIGVNDFKDLGWGGPCPPTGNHQYQFKLFALDNTLQLEAGATQADLEEAMLGHVLEQAVLNGYYARAKA
jgi:Raf kinase inhibitor-like YbhB/YbcL family protein